MNNQPTTAVRRYPQKPERSVPVISENEMNQVKSLQFLNEFVKEARKEIRKRERITVLSKKSEEDYTAMSFVFDSFSLTIDFEGGQVL